VRVLVVEDQIDLADSVARVLRRSGMAVDGTSALERAAVVAYDLVVLDRDQPGTHGDEVYRTLAAGERATRVLMLTASGAVAERVDGLGLGADDYSPSRSPTPSWHPSRVSSTTSNPAMTSSPSAPATACTGSTAWPSWTCGSTERCRSSVSHSRR
jgi:CheY-like chemotaxis protein